MEPTPSHHHDPLVYRLVQILSKLNERFAYLSLEKTEGRYHPHSTLLGKPSLSDVAQMEQAC